MLIGVLIVRGLKCRYTEPGHIPNATIDHDSGHWHTIFYIREMEDEFLARFMSDMC